MPSFPLQAGTRPGSAGTGLPCEFIHVATLLGLEDMVFLPRNLSSKMNRETDSGTL